MLAINHVTFLLLNKLQVFTRGVNMNFAVNNFVQAALCGLGCDKAKDRCSSDSLPV